MDQSDDPYTNPTDDTPLQDDQTDRTYTPSPTPVVLMGQNTTHLVYLWVTFISNVFAVVTIALMVRRMKEKKNLAHQGHSHVQHSVVLPAYENLLVIMAVLFAVVALGDTLMIVHMGLDPKQRDILLTIQVSAVCLLAIYSIVPVLLLQRSLALKSYFKVVLAIVPWWTVNFVLSLFLVNNYRCLRDHQGKEDGSHSFHCEEEEKHETLEKIFALTSALPPLLFHLSALFGVTKSRIELRSKTAIMSTLFVTCYAGLWLCINIISLFTEHDTLQLSALLLMKLGVFALTSMNLVFPFALYKSLVADTKYWRGLGKYNKGGFGNSDEKNGVNGSIGPMSIDIASKNVQRMMGKDDDILLDFCYMKLDTMIGCGATAKVYKGTYKKRPVAVKIFTPPEITEEDVDHFSMEARLAATLVHENIVTTLGLCVRPPQIGMVTELCEHGSLQEFVRDNNVRPFVNTLWRLRCAIDAIAAVKYLHSINVLHRDIKLGNYFLSANGIVKLGDFGESTLFDIVQKKGSESRNSRGSRGSRSRGSIVRSPQSRHSSGGPDGSRHSGKGASSQQTQRGTESKVVQKANRARMSLMGIIQQNKTQTKMSIVGTISNMAPEMINNASSYTEAVDIYSLGVTMWEIWTGKEPFGDFNQFQIYKLVGEEGQRPPLPEGINPVYKKAMEKAWMQDPERRAGAQELLSMLRKEHERITTEMEQQKLNGMLREEKLPPEIPRCLKVMRESSLKTPRESEAHHQQSGIARTVALSSAAMMKSGRNLMTGLTQGHMKDSHRTLNSNSTPTAHLRAESDVSDITMMDFGQAYDDDFDNFEDNGNGRNTIELKAKSENDVAKNENKVIDLV